MKIKIKGFGQTGGVAIKNDIIKLMNRQIQRSKVELDFFINDAVSKRPSVVMEIDENEMAHAQRISRRLQQICGLVHEEMTGKKPTTTSVTTTYTMN